MQENGLIFGMLQIILQIISRLTTPRKIVYVAKPQG